MNIKWYKGIIDLKHLKAYDVYKFLFSTTTTFTIKYIGQYFIIGSYISKILNIILRYYEAITEPYFKIILRHLRRF